MTPINWALTLDQLADFKNHPFKVEMNTELFELMQSIEKEGVLVPLLARPNLAGEGYELIAGHRRKAASKWAGVDKVPVMVAELDDNQAVIAMVDSNLQREHIKPSEKAFAYRMRLEAMKQQGKRTDLTSCQVGKKTENSTVELAEVETYMAENGEWGIRNMEKSGKIDSNKELAKQVGESQRQINRYIRLTYLIPQILDMVDEEKIAFTVAVELSYLNEEEQYELHAVMDMEQCTPSLSQANRLKRMSQSGTLDMDAIYLVMEEEKPNQREQIRIRSDRLNPYFPEDYTDRQKIELIENLVKEWHREQVQSKSR
ncbi:ParB/RepB/Spo0J family partition protein [bacterium D16-36]|nr:ParB/RepB/Spo0J family partition protein [bacterium D16-36]